MPALRTIAIIVASVVAIPGLFALFDTYRRFLVYFVRSRKQTNSSCIPGFPFILLSVAISPWRTEWWLYPLACFADPVFWMAAYVFLWRPTLRWWHGERPYLE